MSLSQLRVPSAGWLNTRFSAQRAPFQYIAEILGNSQHPLYYRTRDEFLNTPTDVLRWKIITNMSKKQLPKEVTRRRLKRRWQEAFRLALKTRGLNDNGQVLDAEKAQPRPIALRGTMEVHVYGGNGFDAPFKFLVRQADETLKAITKKQLQ